MTVLATIVLAWWISTIICDKDPNEFYNFRQNKKESYIFATYMISTLTLRMVAAGFFAYALWEMYSSMQNVNTLKDKVSSFSFLTHFFSMLIYIIGRTLNTLDFIGSAIRQKSSPLWFGMTCNIVSILAFLICYLSIIRICHKMFKNY